MGALLSMIEKETLHIARDRSTMLITLLMPMLLLVLFGFAISTEVNNVRVVVTADRFDDVSRDVVERLRANGSFSVVGILPATEAEAMIRRGEADAAMVIRFRKGVAERQIVVDASNPMVARAAAAYMRSAVSPSSQSRILTTTLYNPQMKSAYNFVPGIMGMIFILICAIMTSVSIVSEKENGTMDMLLVSPVRPGVVIIGKLVPYFLLSCAILAVMLTIAYSLLELPVSESVGGVITLSLIYIALSLSIGLLVSTLVKTQVSAMIVSAVIFMLPVIMLSGMIFPIDNMPLVLQWFSAVVPARWYIAAMRKLMIQQFDFIGVISEAAILLAMAAVILMVAIKKFNTKQ